MIIYKMNIKNLCNTIDSQTNKHKFIINDLINNEKIITSFKKDRYNQNIGIPLSLNKATKYIKVKGIVATMPFLVAKKSQTKQKKFL